MRFMARSVLVSGGCGFIGSHIVDRLLLRGDLAELVVVDNLWTGSRSNLAHVKDARLRVEVQDVENFTSAHRFDEIIHLASPASPPCRNSHPPGARSPQGASRPTRWRTGTAGCAVLQSSRSNRILF